MKKLSALLLLLIFLLPVPAHAEDSCQVIFTVVPFESKVSGEGQWTVYYETMVSGEERSFDLNVFDVTVSMEKHGKEMAFSFNRELELVSCGVTAPVQMIVLESNRSARLQTPTKDPGAYLDILWNPADISPFYRDLIQSVKGILNGEVSTRYTSGEDYSVMFEVQSAWDPDEKTLGYALIDIDGDGTDELMFGELGPDNMGTALYDLYTVRTGEVVHLFCGSDRNRLYLSTEDGFIHQGSGSAFLSFTAYYVFTQQGLQLLRSVIYDSDRNASDPWFLSYTDPINSAGGQPISETEAQRILKMYEGQRIDMTPLGN